jgi:hypothetical protein
VVTPEEINADIGNRFMQELKPLGLLSDAQQFGQVFAVVIFSLFPYDPQQALQLYAANTMQRYRNLLQITSQRLILAVPYESDEPEIAYGHEQLFSRDKLEAVGTWCLQQLGGQGRITYEDCAGGLLLIERSSS